MKKSYYETLNKYWPLCQPCEHCDGENSSMVRLDRLRGLVCPECDKTLDKMLGE